jgi:hypothetical protein
LSTLPAGLPADLSASCLAEGGQAWHQFGGTPSNKQRRDGTSFRFGMLKVIVLSHSGYHNTKEVI